MGFEGGIVGGRGCWLKRVCGNEHMCHLCSLFDMERFRMKERAYILPHEGYASGGLWAS